MPRATRKERSMALFETLLKLDSPEECCAFLEDLCTPNELRAMEQRFDVAVCLEKNMLYLDILEKTGASSATVSRVRRAMLDGGNIVRDVIKRCNLVEAELKDKSV